LNDYLGFNKSLEFYLKKIKNNKLLNTREDKEQSYLKKKVKENVNC